MSSTSIEEVAKAAPNGIKWMQLYIFKDRKIVLDLISRAEKSGFKALVITVDSPITVKGRKFTRNKHFLHPLLQFVLSYFYIKCIICYQLTFNSFSFINQNIYFD